MKSKKIIIATVSTIVAIAILWFCFGGKSKSANYVIETAQAVRGDVSEAVTATGTIEPVTQVEVGTQVSGIIDKLYADYNSIVTKGQLIAEMDKVTLQSELTSQQATYDGAKAEYEYQEKNFFRNKALHEKQLISDTEYEESKYNYYFAYRRRSHQSGGRRGTNRSCRIRNADPLYHCCRPDPNAGYSRCR